MRTAAGFIVALALASGAGAGASSIAAQPPLCWAPLTAPAAVEELALGLSLSWSWGDSGAFVAAFAPGARLSLPFAGEAAGSEAIEALLRRELAGPLRRTWLQVSPRSLRLLRPEVAVGEWDLTLSRPGAAGERPVAGTPERLLVVLVQRDGVWKIEEARSTGPPPR